MYRLAFNSSNNNDDLKLDRKCQPNRVIVYLICSNRYNAQSERSLTSYVRTVNETYGLKVTLEKDLRGMKQGSTCWYLHDSDDPINQDESLILSEIFKYSKGCDLSYVLLSSSSSMTSPNLSKSSQKYVTHMFNLGKHRDSGRLVDNTSFTRYIRSLFL